MKLLRRARSFLSSFRIFVLIGIYGLIATLSLWGAFLLRFDFIIPTEQQIRFLATLAWFIPTKLAILYFFRQYSTLLTYFSIPDLTRIGGAMLLASSLCILVNVSGHHLITPPRSVILADFIFSFMGLCFFRLGLRLFKEGAWGGGLKSETGPRKRVAIIGAGDVGAQLSRELTVRQGMGREPVAFFDDDPGKWRSYVHNLPVIGKPELIGEREDHFAFDEAIIALPSAPAKRIGEIVKILQKRKIPFSTVPSFYQLVSGKVSVTSLRSVEIQDLLGRDTVNLETEAITRTIRGKVILVTGAGGSIGSEICRQILQYQPDRLLMLDHCEVQLFPIEQELIDRGFGGIILPLVANIRDVERMQTIFSRYRPEIVFHAAAHKHVPMMESQPGEALKNNFLGTRELARLSASSQVKQFVLISTDKAINPTSVMGASKRMAELYLNALQRDNSHQTQFMAVRFGNVLGSSGSVVPIFKRQIQEGGPVKVTHPEVTRYFMTIPEATGLVLQCATLGEGGEVFILDMGQPVKIVDLARQLIELSGLRPDLDIEIEFTGLRPGEKLYEELSHEREDISPTSHAQITRLADVATDLTTMEKAAAEVARLIQSGNAEQFKRWMQGYIPEYRPYLSE